MTYFQSSLTGQTINESLFTGKKKLVTPDEERKTILVTPEEERKTILVTPNNSMDAAEQLRPLTQHSRVETASCTRWCHCHFVDRAQQLLQPGAYRRYDYSSGAREHFNNRSSPLQ
jgi:hypothetical protein